MIETIKTIMQTTPSYHMEGLPMAQVAILRNIRSLMRKRFEL